MNVKNSVYHNSDEYEDEASDSDKKVEASKYPITDTHVHDTSVGTTSNIQPSLESESLDEGGVASPKA